MFHEDDKLYRPENPLDLKITGQAEHASISDYLPLQATCEFDVFGEKVGSLVLQHGSASRIFTWGWEIYGTHVYDLAQNLIGLYDSVAEGILNIPYYLIWDIHIGGEATSYDRTLQLLRLIEHNNNPEIDQLLVAELGRAQQLARTGVREPKFARLYVTYKPKSDKQGHKSSDKIEALGKEVYELWTGVRDSISNKKTQNKIIAVEEQFKTAFLRGYRSTSTLLTGTFGLSVRPMGEPEIWTNLRHRFSGEAAGKSPNIIRCKIDERGVRLSSEITGEMHITGHLIKDYPVKADPEWVYTKRFDPETGAIRNRYTGILRATGQYKSLAHEFHQCRAMWDLLANESCKDTEFCIQLTPSDSKIAREAASQLYRQSMKQFEATASKRDYDATADENTRLAREALRALHLGDSPIRVGFCVLIHRQSLAQLDIACRDFISRCRWLELVREYVVTHRLWLQTLPCNDDPMLQYKVFGYDYARVKRTGAQFDRRIYYGACDAIAFFPIARTLPNDEHGIEFIAPDKQPFRVDFFHPGKEKHWCIIAAHRSSKSVLANNIADHALAMGQPVTWLDYPPADGSSTLRDRCLYLGGTHIDIQLESLNLIHIPDFSSLPPGIQQDRLRSLVGYWIEQLMILVGPTGQDIQLEQIARTILELSIATYLDDPVIQSRYGNAIREGFGSSSWQSTPTLQDLARFVTREKLESRLANLGDRVQQALDLLQFNLSRITDTRTTIGKAISLPSTVCIDNPLTVFSLRNMNEGQESLAYSLAAYSSAIQKSLSHEISHVFIEEAQNLVAHTGVLKLASNLATKGGKDGVRLGLVTNSFTRIAQSSAGADLLANINTKFVGRIEPGSVEPLAQSLGIPHEFLDKCASERFYTNRKEGYSNWLIQDYRKHTMGRWYAPWESVVLSASNANERHIKQWFFDRIPDKHEALTACTRYFRDCWQTGQDLVVPKSFTQVEQIIAKKLC
jgi:hypothetical protein